EGEEVLVHGLRVGRSPDGARRGPTRACGPARWRSRPGWRGGAGWSEGWRAGALPGVGWVLGPAWWVLGPARWAPGCRPRVGGRVGGVGAAEVAGPGLGEVFGDLDAVSVEVVDDGDNVAAGADAPPGPAGLGRGGGQSGGVVERVRPGGVGVVGSRVGSGRPLVLSGGCCQHSRWRFSISVSPPSPAVPRRHASMWSHSEAQEVGRVQPGTAHMLWRSRRCSSIAAVGWYLWAGRGRNAPVAPSVRTRYQVSSFPARERAIEGGSGIVPSSIPGS